MDRINIEEEEEEGMEDKGEGVEGVQENEEEEEMEEEKKRKKINVMKSKQIVFNELKVNITSILSAEMLLLIYRFISSISFVFNRTLESNV